jgi:hypothetical protein
MSLLRDLRSNAHGGGPLAVKDPFAVHGNSGPYQVRDQGIHLSQTGKAARCSRRALRKYVCDSILGTFIN